MSSKNTFSNCPKCQAEITPIKIGNIVAEYCPNCHGLFVDYKELKSPLIDDLETIPAKKRRDSESLDAMLIQCPKCKTQMKKYKYNKKAPVLDVCPSCQGVWFDEGELYKFRKSNTLFYKPKKIILRLVCFACNGTFNYQDAIKKENIIPRCPRCNQSLSFEGSGEELVPRLPQKDFVAGIVFIVGIIFIYLICRKMLDSPKQALLLTGTVGSGVLFILIRAIIYKKFAWRIGINPNRFRDFDLD